MLSLPTRLSLECKVASKSESCGQCVMVEGKVYSSYNVHGNGPSVLQGILDEKKRLDAEERDTLGKLLRLKDQRKALLRRADEVFSYELVILDKEEGQTPPTQPELAAQVPVSPLG